MRDVAAGRFLTTVLAVISPQGPRVRLDVAAAGHPPPLVMRADGSEERVPAGGPMIGVAAASEFPTTSVELAPGDTVLLYTDGLTDAHAPGRILTEADLSALLGRGRGRSAAEIAALVEEHATGGQPARDDIALLVIQVPDGSSGSGG